jgi:hypothetical protein
MLQLQRNQRLLGDAGSVVGACVRRQRQYGSIAKILSYLSATWCWISLLVFGVVLIVASVGTPLHEELLKFRKNPWNWDALGQVFTTVALGFPIVLASGVAFGRFLLRALPLTMSPQDRGHSGVVTIPVAFGSLCILSFLMIPASALHNAPKPDGSFVADIPTVSWIVALLWASGVTGLLIRRYRMRFFVDRPFVLFLRRFSTLPDRTVIALILKQATYNAPIVFLVPTHSRPGDWDPFLVGFAGLKLLHPWASAPIIVRAPDNAWQEAAYELIRRAQMILLDTSETSSALHAEAEMINRAGRWPDTVCLRHSVPNTSADKARIGGPPGVRIIEYKKSWIRALPKMVVGLGIVFISISISFYFLDTRRFIFWFYLSPWLPIILFIFVIVPVSVMHYFSIFVRPMIDRKAKMTLGNVLRGTPQPIRGWLILPVVVLIILPFARLSPYFYGAVLNDIYNNGRFCTKFR